MLLGVLGIAMYTTLDIFLYHEKNILGLVTNCLFSWTLFPLRRNVFILLTGVAKICCLGLSFEKRRRSGNEEILSNNINELNDNTNTANVTI